MTAWRRVQNTPDYETDTHYARYVRTVRGQGAYVTHSKHIDPRDRKGKNAYSVGGLPTIRQLNHQ